ncbi:hypothetical protein HOY34_19580 [Xinfangfangia sp. D13-10-4-6]|uniref:COG4223 family protein n=1 Tax=Pseudogemmobacter hezensis TaxID=2737662 RepID=UPI001552797C|nr:hypothetical protein [Pseudogemmobacter hezensis]NPD17391.1 hypothetical protein [Pseudogemmobacter hezensis]
MADENKPPRQDAPAEDAPGQDVPGQNVLVQEGIAEPPQSDAAEAGAASGPTIAPTPAPRRARSGAAIFGGTILGTGLAAAIGFAVSHFNLLGLRNDAGFDALTDRLAVVETQIRQAEEAASAADKEAIGAANAALKEAQTASAALSAQDQKLGTLSAQLQKLGQVVDAQAAALPDGSIPPAAFAALRAEVDALKSAPAAGADPEALRQQINAELDARAAQVAAAAEKEAEATRQAAVQEAALITLREAVRNGLPYSDALAALGASDVPESLAQHAETGLPSAADLAQSFPDAARAALEASLRGEVSGGLGDQALSLLRIGTGARSLTPQEGTDPDAVLSRAEAAAQAGDLAAALTELQGLPPEGLAEMQAWIGQAQSRIDAEAALAALKP